MTNAMPEMPHATKSITIHVAVYPDVSPWITAKEMQARNAAPKMNPNTSIRRS